MIDEKTTLKLKQIAKGLGNDWIVDFINSTHNYFVMRKGHHAELRLRKVRDTKFKFTAYLFLTREPGVYYIHCELNSDQVQLNYSVNNIVNTLKTKIIPTDLDQQILNMKDLLLKAEKDRLLHEYFMQSLNAFGVVKFPKHRSCRSYFVDLTPNIEDEKHKTIIEVYRRSKENYNISTELSRDNIIKVIGFIKELINNESRRINSI